MDVHGFFEFAVIAFEVAGAAVMIGGFVLALALGAATLVVRRSGADAYRRVKSALGGSILLGLEILVAADIVKTVTSELGLEDAFALGLIVIIRTILSFTIQIEIEGHMPWKRALYESGAVHVARAVRDTTSGVDAPGRSGEPATKEGG